MPAQTTPEITSRQAPITFSSRVNVVSVPVVVRDRNGHTVDNLRKADFRLLDQGKKQIITEFNVLRIGGASGAYTAQPNARGEAQALPDRYIAYVFDDIHMNSDNLTQVREAIQRHFAEPMAPNARVAIATASGRVWLDFTNDRDKINDALRRIMSGPNSTALRDDQGGFLAKDENPCPPAISYWQADQVVNYQNSQEINAAETAALACYGVDPNPPSLAYAASDQVLGAGNTDTQNLFSALRNLMRCMSVMPGSRSIVLMSSGFFVTRDFYQTEESLVDDAVRAKITVSGLDARGVYTANTAEANAEADAMQFIAAGTGGSFYHDNRFKDEFDATSNPPECIYILGFSPADLKYDGRYHRLEVTLVNARGCQLQARRGYWAPNHAQNAAQQAKQEIQDAVFSLDEVRDIPLDIATEFFKTSEVAAELTIESKLDLNGLKFQTAGDRSEDTLTVVTALFDQDGHYLKGIEKVVNLRLRRQTLEKLLISGLTDKENFDVAPGRYIVRVVVRDSEGRAMAARNATVEVQ